MKLQSAAIGGYRGRTYFRLIRFSRASARPVPSAAAGTGRDCAVLAVGWAEEERAGARAGWEDWRDKPGRERIGEATTGRGLAAATGRSDRPDRTEAGAGVGPRGPDAGAGARSAGAGAAGLEPRASSGGFGRPAKRSVNRTIALSIKTVPWSVCTEIHSRMGIARTRSAPQTIDRNRSNAFRTPSCSSANPRAARVTSWGRTASCSACCPTALSNC